MSKSRLFKTFLHFFPENFFFVSVGTNLFLWISKFVKWRFPFWLVNPVCMIFFYQGIYQYNVLQMNDEHSACSSLCNEYHNWISLYGFQSYEFRSYAFKPYVQYNSLFEVHKWISNAVGLDKDTFLSVPDTFSNISNTFLSIPPLPPNVTGSSWVWNIYLVWRSHLASTQF